MIKSKVGLQRFDTALVPMSMQSYGLIPDLSIIIKVVIELIKFRETN